MPGGFEQEMDMPSTYIDMLADFKVGNTVKCWFSYVTWINKDHLLVEYPADRDFPEGMTRVERIISIKRNKDGSQEIRTKSETELTIDRMIEARHPYTLAPPVDDL
jgi:hypothetical protein